ncbi:MAG: sugar transferase [Isosphaeraceae bacterium]
MADEHSDDGWELERDSQPELPTGKAFLRFQVKRAIDMTGALTGLLLFAPVVGVIALLIRLDSRGPVLFKQLRRGYRDQEFWILKFRTTSMDAEQRLVELESSNESDGGVLFKLRNDPPITRLGAFLRRSNLDKLPQLINVLKGEMSLVGPRPLPLRDSDRLLAWDPEGYKQRREVLPGITGLGQVSGRGELSYERMLQLDSDYVKNWSLGQDLRIICKTFLVTLLKVGEIPEGATSETDRQELSTRQEVARASILWNRFGLLLRPASKEKYFDPDLAEHAADLYEALTKATTRGWRWRNLLIACFTLKALLKALNCHRIELRRMNMNRRFLVMMLLGGFAATCVGAYIGRIEDNINLPFANDHAVLGRWTSVDFVDEPSQFDPEGRHCGGDLYVKELKFRPGGKTSALLEGVGTSTVFTWTKGVLINSVDKTAAKYEIKKIGDQEYLFLEWKSGDYTYLHRKPMYYVLKVLADQKGRNEDNINLPFANDDEKETGTQLVLTPVRRFGIPSCYAKNSESSAWGIGLSRP